MLEELETLGKRSLLYGGAICTQFRVCRICLFRQVLTFLNQLKTRPLQLQKLNNLPNPLLTQPLCPARG